MSRYFEYLSKAQAQGTTGQLPGALARVIPQTTYLPEFPGNGEWTQLVGELWRRRSAQDELSIGVFPCGEAEDHGWFAAGLALSARQTLDRETLLIDLGSGHAALASTLRTPARPGLSELLNSSPVARPGCVHETGWSRVYLLPQGGVRNFDSRETAERLRWLHTAVQRDFPVVITRFPRPNPSGALRDFCNIPKMAVLTVTPGLSRKSELRRDSKALRAAGANLIGLVFTGSNLPGARDFNGAIK